MKTEVCERSVGIFPVTTTTSTIQRKFVWDLQFRISVYHTYIKHWTLAGRFIMRDFSYVHFLG
jgi:hypothetical protein